MAKIKISQFDSNPVNNTDIDGINLAEGMAPGLVNNAIRELMAQLKDFQVGSAGDDLTVGGDLSVTGTSSFTGAITMSGRLVDALPAGTKMLFQQSTAPIGWVKDTTHNNKALRIVSGSVSSGGSVAFTTAFASKAVTGTIANETATGTVGATSLSIAQMPAHTHTGSGTTSTVSDNHTHTFSGTTSTIGDHAHSVNDPSHAHNYVRRLGLGGGGGNDQSAGGLSTVSTTASFTGVSINGAGSHSHTYSGTTSGFSNNHTHTYSFTTSSQGSGATHTHSFTGDAHNHTFTGTAIDLAVQYVDVIVCTKS